MQQSTDTAPRPFAADFPLGLRLRDIQTSFVGWGLYMAALTCYCMMHQKFVSSLPPDLPGSVIWAIREWAIWLVLTPVAFKILRQYEATRRVPLFVKMGAGILLVSLTFRVGLDLVTGARSFAASLTIFFPRHLAALAAVVLIWHLFLRPKPAVAGTVAEAANEDIGATEPMEPACPETILVSRGNDECLIRVDRIQCISAAGNYVEVYCDNRPYLMRATMKQVEELLPPPTFLRMHRSHIINVNEIERIKTRPSGNGVVQLRCGKVLSVSRKYKHRLQQYRLQAA